MRRRIWIPAMLAAASVAAGCGRREQPEAAPAGGQAAPPVVAAGEEARRAIFLAKGCPQCHSISGLGITSQAEVAPDLTGAYADVQSRFGVTLEGFLDHPTGTMQVVLGSMIQLTPAERDSIIRLLKELHEEAEEESERESDGDPHE